MNVLKKDPVAQKNGNLSWQVPMNGSKPQMDSVMRLKKALVVGNLSSLTVKKFMSMPLDTRLRSFQKTDKNVPVQHTTILEMTRETQANDDFYFII